MFINKYRHCYNLNPSIYTRREIQNAHTVLRVSIQSHPARQCIVAASHNRTLPHGGPGPIGPTFTPAATIEQRCAIKRSFTCPPSANPDPAPPCVASSTLHIRSAAAVVLGKTNGMKFVSSIPSPHMSTSAPSISERYELVP